MVRLRETIEKATQELDTQNATNNASPPPMATGGYQRTNFPYTNDCMPAYAAPVLSDQAVADIYAFVQSLPGP
jgi:hypothetical protein